MLFDHFSPGWIKKLVQLLTKFEPNWSILLLKCRLQRYNIFLDMPILQGLDVSSRTGGYCLGSLTREECPQIFLGDGRFPMYLQGLAGQVWPCGCVLCPEALLLLSLTVQPQW